jgi:hypothetical protein
MPVQPQAQYSQGTDITQLARTLCNDPTGQYFSDTLLLPFVNSAARRIARELANNGQTTLVEDEYIATIPPVSGVDPGLQVQLSFNGIAGNLPSAPNPTLPSDLIFPAKLWERDTGSVEEFQPMRDWTAKGGLPSRPQGVALGDWEWRSDSIYFVGSTISRDIRIRYMGSTINFTLVNGVINGQLGELDAIDAVAYWVAAAVLKPRGSVIADDYAKTSEMLIDQLVSGAVRQQQYAPVRRKPYRGMHRGRRPI